MFGHDDDNKPQTNLPDPTPDEHLATDPLDGGVVSNMDDGTVPPVPGPTATTDTSVLTTPEEGALAAAVVSPTPGVPALDNSNATDTLLTLKQQALQQLTPLMEHLEQTP